MFGIGVGSVEPILVECLNHIESRRAEFIKFPTTPAECAKIAEGFAAARAPYARLCDIIGAIDGTFIFTSVGSDDKLPFANFKWPRSSILLEIIVDSDRQITWFDCEHSGNTSDQGVVLDTDMTGVCDAGRPDPWVLDGLKEGKFYRIPQDYVLLGDSGFTFNRQTLTVGDSNSFNHVQKLAKLHKWAASRLDEELELHSHLNGILSSHRVVVEQTFGELVRSWTILRSGKYDPERTKLITIVCCILHNIRRKFRIEAENAATGDQPSDGRRMRPIQHDGWKDTEGEAFPGSAGAMEHKARSLLRHRLRAAKRPRDQDPLQVVGTRRARRIRRPKINDD